MKADAVIGLAGFGGEPLVENTLQVIGCDTHAVVLAVQVQMLAVGIPDDLGGEMQYTLIAAGVSHRVGGIDDQVLQDQAQHRARRARG